MEPNGGLSNLAIRLKEKAEQERIQTEKVFTEQLQTLSNKLRESSTNALRTMSDAMEREITSAAETLNQRYRLLSMAFSKQWLSMTILGIFLCFGMLLSGWFWVELVKMNVEEQEAELARLETACQELRRTLATLKAGTWGVTLREDSNGRFVVLPQGMNLDTTQRWTVGTQKAIKLE